MLPSNCVSVLVVLALYVVHVKTSDSVDEELAQNINCSGESNLREGWYEYFSEVENRAYYYNSLTEETFWDYPYEKCNRKKPAGGELPTNWRRLYADDVGEYYYVNIVTNDKQWTKPENDNLNRSPMRVIVDAGEPKPSERMRKLPKKKRAPLNTVFVAQYGSFVESCGKKNRPCGGIQQGINRASDNAKVYVQPGRYSGQGNFMLNFEGKSINLLSAVDKEAVIDCENRGPVVNPLVPSGHLQISGFRIVDCPMTKQGTQVTGFQHLPEAQQRQFVKNMGLQRGLHSGEDNAEILKLATEMYKQQLAHGN